MTTGDVPRSDRTHAVSRQRDTLRIDRIDVDDRRGEPEDSLFVVGFLPIAAQGIGGDHHGSKVVQCRAYQFIEDPMSIKGSDLAPVVQGYNQRGLANSVGIVWD